MVGSNVLGAVLLILHVISAVQAAPGVLARKQTVRNVSKDPAVVLQEERNGVVVKLTAFQIPTAMIREIVAHVRTVFYATGAQHRRNVSERDITPTSCALMSSMIFQNAQIFLHMQQVWQQLEE
jgi:hypothetical protein